MTDWQMKLAYERKSGESWEDATAFVRELWEDAWVASKPAVALDDERAAFEARFTSGFLSDVMTAAGLVSSGKQSKALASRLAEECMNFRAASPQATVPLTDQQRDAIEWAAGCAHVAALGKPINGTEGQRWRVLSDLFRASQDGHNE